MSAISSRNKVL